MYDIIAFLRPAFVLMELDADAGKQQDGVYMKVASGVLPHPPPMSYSVLGGILWSAPSFHSRQACRLADRPRHSSLHV